MGAENQYFIPLSEKQTGVLSYNFKLGDSFFEELEDAEIKKGDLVADIECEKVSSSFHLHFNIEGSVLIPCDRCLDDMEQPISTEGEFIVRFGEGNDTNENVVYIPENEQGIDISWNIYEFIALNVPMRHIHPEGMCNQEMAKRLATLMTNGDEELNDNDTASSKEGNHDTDPRWNALKNLNLE